MGILKDQLLFEIFFNIINIFTFVTFDQFNAPLKK